MTRSFLTTITILIVTLLVYSTNTSVVKRSDGDVVETVENIDKGADADEQDMNKFKTFLNTYTSLEPNHPVTSQSSTNGDGTPVVVDLKSTPAFMDEVAKIQKSSGLKVTGKLTKAVVVQATQSRCGLPENSDDEDGPAAYTTSTSWENNYDYDSKRYYLSYYIPRGNMPSGLTYSEFKEGVVAAMCMWEKVSNVRFERERRTATGTDLKISFADHDHGDNYSFDGAGGTLAHAFYPINGVLHFDKSEDWYLAKDETRQSRKKDIFTVAAHELGHNLGLRHSTVSGTLMAAYYNFQGSYMKYSLPEDDVLGINKLYEDKIPTNILREPRQSACKKLQDEFNFDSNSKPVPTQKPIKRVTTTTKKPIETAKQTQTVDSGEICKDDKDLGEYCPSWKRSGYCTEKSQAAAMRRRCPLTCGICPDTPDTPEKPKTVCSVEQMSTVTTTYDNNGYYDSWHFKDDYYVRAYSYFNQKNANRVNHLTENFDVTDGNVFRFHSDPKRYITGSFKYRKRDMFSKTTNLKALIAGQTFYLAFEDDDSGTVSQYTRGTPTTTYVGAGSVKDMFPGYPYNKVSATYTERKGREYLYTLFNGDRYWQYKAKSQDELYDQSSKKIAKFEPVKNRTSQPIINWYGVHACNVDSVFQYEGEPYFLKDNLFWPAKSDSKSDSSTARDIRYYFYRCSEVPSKTYPLPTCVSGRGGSGGGSGSASLVSFHIATFLLISMLTTLLQN